MAVFTKELLSGSVNGRPIKVVATVTAGTLLHTAHVTAKDEVYLYAVNTDAAIDTFLFIELGGVTNPDDLIKVQMKAGKGLVLTVPGLPMTGGVIIRAFADDANIINILGWVNRIA